MRPILVAAMAAVLSLAVGDAAAQSPVPPQASCAGIAGTPQAATVWWGHFSGGRMEVYNGIAAPVGISVEACFVTEHACRRWLYHLKGDYSALPSASTDGCSRGYRGAR